MSERRSTESNAMETTGVAGGGAGVTRRRALQVGALAAGALAAGGTAAHAGTVPDRGAPSAAGSGAGRTFSFDEDWRFLRGDPGAAEAASFDDSAWRRLDVPHDWSIEDLPGAPTNVGGETADPSIFDYTTSLGINGPSPGNVPSLVGPFDRQNSAGGGSTAYTVGGLGWYRKHFRLSDFVDARSAHEASPHVELRLDGVYEVVDVWLNGQHLDFHPYGYTPIVVDLTPALDPGGDNVLAVRVNNSGANSRWYTGSGIYRHTWLTITGPVRVPTYGVFVTTPTVRSSSADVHVQTAATNLGQEARRARAQVTLVDPDGHVVGTHRSASLTVAPGSTVSFDADLTVGRPRRWSPDRPHLYTARVDLYDESGPTDSDSATFGIRSIEWNATNGFVLNGERTELRGANIHSSNGPMGAVALGRSEQRRIEILKAAGFNAIRTAHNPPSPELLDYCDQLGMLVWDEFVDIWDAGKTPDDYHVYFPEYWRADLASMIKRDRNHPSVVIWSMGNEIQDTTNGQRGAQMKALIQTLDSSRPITQGATPHKAATDADYQYVDVSDFHYDIDDPSPESLHATYPDRAVTQSESWPASIYDDYQFAQDNPWYAGSFVWAGWDYLGESGAGAPKYGPPSTDPSTLPHFGSARYPWFQDFQSDIDLIGQRKPQNYWRAVVYGLSPLELLVERPAPGTGNVQFAHWWAYYDEQPSWNWDVASGTEMIVHAYTSADTVELYLNGTLVATNTVTSADKAVSTFTVPYDAGQLTAVAYRGGREVGRKSLTTTGSPASLRLTSDRKLVTTDRDDLAHILVEVLDHGGRLVPDATLQVGFEVEGAGSLAAVGNGNPHNIDSFQQPSRYTWHGQALIIVRPAKRPGVMRVAATTPGLRTARLTIPVGRAQRRPPA